MKRFVCAVLFTALLFIMAACSSGGSGEPQATTTPTSSTSRNVQAVKVNETVANAETVESTAQAEPSATAAPVDTPATGDFPVVYLAGVLGLILLCSAGLLMLRRI